MTTPQTVVLETVSGFKMSVRPAMDGDEAALAAFFEHVSKEDLRFRFLSSFLHVPEKEIVAMTHVDHRQTEDFLAFLPGTTRIIANVMLAADKKMEVAEVAVSIDQEFKGHEIEKALLEHVTAAAKGRGIKKLMSIESRENIETIAFERRMGFTPRGVEGDPTLVVLETSL